MYIDSKFTWRQIIIRLVFATISLAAFIAYATKIICRVREKHKKYLTLEQKSLLGLVFFLWLFNDPMYVAHIYFPGVATFVLS